MPAVETVTCLCGIICVHIHYANYDTRNIRTVNKDYVSIVHMMKSDTYEVVK